MDAEQRWQAISRDVETLRTQMENKAKELDLALEEYYTISRNVARAELQKLKAWEAYQQSLRERGL